MGNQHSTVIEINGQKYDARTGTRITENATPRSQALKRSIDGVARPVRHSKDVHTKQAKSKTLMRHAVKRPGTQATLQASSPQKVAASDLFKVSRQEQSGRTQFQPDKQRIKRALAVKQNNLVRKFNDVGIASSPTTPAMTAQGVKPQSSVRPAAHTSTHVHEAAPVKPSHSVIEQGLRAADSHNQQPPQKSRKSRRRTKLASIAATSAAVFLLAGFFGYQNAPNLSMRYAAARSGVNANMPGFSPSGFALNHKIQYTPGQVTLTFRSNSDDRQFNIVQRESTWNSQSLHTNYVANIDTSAQTYEDKGRTIYIYGDSNATWVDGGVWYDIQGNSQLNSDQLIRIASSI